MAKSENLGDIVLDCWEGSRSDPKRFLSTLSDEAFAGYATGMMYGTDRRINKLAVGPEVVYAKVLEMAKAKTI